MQRKKNKLQWKYRLLILMLGIAFTIIFVSFTVIYQLFMNTLQENMRETTTNAFKQAEINLVRKMESNVQAVTRLLYSDLIYDFEVNSFRNDVERSEGMMNLIQELNGLLNMHYDILGVGVLSPDGRFIATTKKNRNYGNEPVPMEELSAVLAASNATYPEVFWTNDLSEILSEESGIHILTDSAAVVGVRSLGGYGPDKEDSAYFLIAIRESALEECYSLIPYMENEVMLLTKEGKVISGTDKSKIGTILPYYERLKEGNEINQFVWEEYQVIQYNTILSDWILVNQVPKKVYEKQTDQLKKAGIVVGCVTICVMCLFFTIWIFKYANPIQRLMNGMKRVEEGEYELVSVMPTGVKELDGLNTQFNSMVVRLKDSIGLIKSHEEALRVEELRTLQYQINPHFLLNSINSIRWIAMMTNHSSVADALVTLNKIIYPILKAPSFWGTVSEEVEFVENYVQMLKIRFGSMLTYQTLYEDEILTYKFPRFVLQPLIENCFTHGMKQGEMLHVDASIEVRSDFYRICVHNSGKGIEMEKLLHINQILNESICEAEIREIKKATNDASESIGLLNVRRRLALLYGNASRLWLESDEENGTSVFIRFPLRCDAEEMREEENVQKDKES